eukprot:Hpha_TRINITY_DN16998_c0_g1::TRINITY_DN16998_c0_g1_i1::g.56244::m.56244
MRAVLFTSALYAAGVGAAEPNPPKFPSSVSVFSPGDTTMQDVVNAAYASNGGHEPSNHGQFSDKRFAFLFKPGRYESLDLPVGYYTHVMGLGEHPSDVVFSSSQGVYCEEGDFSIGGALSTFWRAAENFRSESNKTWYTGTGMLWAVSQAAPLRRVEVAHNLVLFQYVPPLKNAGEASGGYFANVKTGGAVLLGSQQQWFARDSSLGGWEGCVWNCVTVGVENGTDGHCSNSGGKLPITKVSKTPVVAEKPFLTVDTSGKFYLQIPPVKKNSLGYSGYESGTQAVSFEHVYLTQPSDSAAVINAKLAAGLHVVVSPGIYHLTEPLRVVKSGQVLLGLGFATLVSSNQNAVIVVADGIDNVRIAGFLLQAGPLSGSTVAPALLIWGENGGYAGSATAPGVLSDVFARVGGPDGAGSSKVGVEVMWKLQSGHVVIDNTWLWRADHTAMGVPTTATNSVKNGVIVDGAHVTAYGLAVEHVEQDLVLWNGNEGKTYFYQSEFPYDVTQAQFGDPGYAGYRVADTVTSHHGWGLGVYSFFRDHTVTVKSGIVAPKALEKNFVNCLTVHLSGNGTIEHILNEQGAQTNQSAMVEYLCH